MSHVDIYFSDKQHIQQNSRKALLIGMEVCQKPV